MIRDMLNMTADIKRPVSDYDDMGSVVYTLTTVSSAHPCRISQSMPMEVSSGPREWAEATAMVYMEPGTVFQRDDEVHHDSDVYVVLGVKKPSVREHHLSLVCKLQTDGS